ncbi:MAG: hypothetical protein WC511_03260 [Candidatus Pacearchaeota archaeon]
MSQDLFESSVFNKLNNCIRKVKRVAYSDEKFSSEIVSNVLKFDALKKKDPKAKIFQTMDGTYDIRLSRPHIAFDFSTLMQEDNQDVDLMFTDDLLEFEPEDEMIHKSKIPLWVICPLEGGNRVLIKRAW